MRRKLPEIYDATPWKKVFAWFPITINGYRVWLEVVEKRKYFGVRPERRGKYAHCSLLYPRWQTEYREVTK